MMSFLDSPEFANNSKPTQTTADGTPKQPATTPSSTTSKNTSKPSKKKPRKKPLDSIPEGRLIAAGFQRFDHYRTRILLAIGGANWNLLHAAQL
jgi:hypothetical protein